MIGLGTIINSGGIVLGGVIDSFAGSCLSPCSGSLLIKPAV